MRVGIVGLGEVGAAMAAALRATGHDVLCLDARPESATAGKARALGIAMHADAAPFARAADVVLVTSQARWAAVLADWLVPEIPAGTVYADCTAKSVAVRDHIAARCLGHGVAFCDIAIADTVSWPDRKVELLVSGAATGAIASLFDGSRFMPRIVDASKPVSAELKLLRSVYTKGLTALIIEALAAAEKCGTRAEVQRTITAFMAEDFGRIATMLVGTSIKHAQRRAEEMKDVSEVVSALLGGAPMTHGTAMVFQALADSGICSDLATLEGIVSEIAESRVFERLGQSAPAEVAKPGR
ncbi:MAG: DUF1932 domain-containing protein [Betaproteobacteria bacterium]|nr:DUF1932 domain-containing protein [Betaproteobacteria bacterium]